MADLTGKTLGKYQILEKLGRGGMAQVYKGYHPSLQRTVAVKVMLSYLDEGPDPRTGTSFRERFMREARAAAALRHPNIVQVFDFDSQDDAFYMVMEYIEGSSLQELLRQFQARREVIPLATALRGPGAVPAVRPQPLPARRAAASPLFARPTGRAGRVRARRRSAPPTADP